MEFGLYSPTKGVIKRASKITSFKTNMQMKKKFLAYA